MQMFGDNSAKYLAKKLRLLKARLSTGKQHSEFMSAAREKYIHPIRQKMQVICGLMARIQQKVTQIESSRLARLSGLQNGYGETLQRVERQSEEGRSRSYTQYS